MATVPEFSSTRPPAMVRAASLRSSMPSSLMGEPAAVLFQHRAGVVGEARQIYMGVGRPIGAMETNPCPIRFSDESGKSSLFIFAMRGGRDRLATPFHNSFDSGRNGRRLRLFSEPRLPHRFAHQRADPRRIATPSYAHKAYLSPEFGFDHRQTSHAGVFD